MSSEASNIAPWSTPGPAGYLRILLCFWKNSLIRELSFRGHFIVNVINEVLWVAMLLIFVNVVFGHTEHVQDWTKPQYLFLVGTHLLITSIFETFLLGNLWGISEMVRTGDLDFVLIRPASAQFLLSCGRVDYSATANVAVGAGICLYAANVAGQSVTVGSLLLFLALVAVSLTILYSVLFMFAVTSVWLIRQTGLEQLYFYAVNLARYPNEIYKPFLGGALWFVLVFVVPIMLVSNLPAQVVMRTFDWWMVLHLAGSALVLLSLSGLVFRGAMRWYRSASS